MKLIEKLANDYSLNTHENSSDSYEGFLAGFRKAREMAAAICDEHTHDIDGKQPVTLEIERMGEEET